MHKPKPHFLALFGLLCLWSACGLSGDAATTTDTTAVASFNTTKLVGTPFEGLTTGDVFRGYSFLCDQYGTTTVDAFPIKIFLAFFTPDEEATIQDGIDIANTAAGVTLYEITDVWGDDVRVIYKVTEMVGIDPIAIAHTNIRYFYFDERITAEGIVPDWAIEIEQLGITKWFVAHELGHASGIRSHALIDYENNTLTDLEENSLMESSGGNSPILGDYTYMMDMQTQIMSDHLGQEGTLDGSDCDGLKAFYDSLEEQD